MYIQWGKRRRKGGAVCECAMTSRHGWSLQQEGRCADAQPPNPRSTQTADGARGDPSPQRARGHARPAAAKTPPQLGACALKLFSSFFLLSPLLATRARRLGACEGLEACEEGGAVAAPP